jgi:hypothetical protein
MKNRLLITIIISTKEESGKNKEEKIGKRACRLLASFCCERNRYIMPAVKGAVNFQLFQRKTFCGLFHHSVNICRTVQTRMQ